MGADPREIEAARKQSLYWEQAGRLSEAPGAPPTLRRLVELKVELMVETARMLDRARERLKAARLSSNWVGVAEADLQRAHADHRAAQHDLDWWRGELRRCPGAADKPIWVPSRMGSFVLQPKIRDRVPGEEG